MAELTPLEFAKQRKTVALAQGNIAYFELGDGPRTAIFLHGWPLNGFHWRHSIPELAERRRCIAPDFMGLGYTEVSSGSDLSPLSQSKMILALMDKLDVTSADIVANDSGIAVAQLIAADHPERVSSMLLSNGDTHTNCPPDELKPAIEAARNGALAEIISQHLTKPGFSLSPAGLGHICYTDPANLTENAMRYYFSPLLENSVRREQFQQYGVAFEPNPLPAIKDSLEAYKGPVRIIWGTGDSLFKIEWAYWLDNIFPLSRGVRIVDGAKLFFTEEYPEIVVEEALALWA